MKLTSHFSELVDISVPGKWILAGEHSVLRRGPAIAMPHPRFSLRFKFTPQGSGNRETSHLEKGISTEPEILKSVLDPLIEKAYGLGSHSGNARSTPRPQGKVHLQSSIPMGSGFGSSAALCVAVTKWLAQDLEIPDSDQLSFATQLEDFFHGKSSGMDIAICWYAKPLLYRRGETPVPIGFTQHDFRFHDSGYRSSTRECVLKVEEWIDKNPTHGHEVDRQMALATETALQGLKSNDLKALTHSMELSWDCYRKWGLLSPGAEEAREKLLLEGALAVRLTGAGLGGYFVSLWPSNSKSASL